MDYLAELQRLDFDILDPFDNGEFYFEELRNVLSAEEFKQLIIYCNTEIYGMIHSREYASSIRYALMADKVTDSAGKAYFTQMSADEAVHADLLEIIFVKMTGFEPNKEISQALPKIRSTIDEFSELESVLQFFNSELKLVIIFSELYKTCQSEDKKKFMAEFLAEESRHVNNMAEMAVKLAGESSPEERQRGYDFQLKLLSGDNHFFLNAAKKYLISKNYDQQLLDAVNNGKWAQAYLDKLLNRTFPVVKALREDIDYNEFMSRTWT